MADKYSNIVNEATLEIGSNGDLYLNTTQVISFKTQQVDILKDREVLYEKQIKLVRPKWYENKWLYFTYGVIATSVSVKLAGEIVD